MLFLCTQFFTVTQLYQRMKYEVLIIGAGAAGLIAMKELTKAGYQVCMLEAAANAGGRISTIEKEFTEPVEAGPEFIHGNLDLSLQLINEAGLTLIPTEGNMIPVKNGKWLKEETHDPHWDEFINQLYQLEKDCSLADFLDQYFAADKYAALRDSVRGYAEGFDLADVSKASSIFAREEWSQHYETQYRIKEGYGKLIDYLAEQCTQQDSAIHFNQPVYRIVHSANSVTVFTTNNKSFQAEKIIITVPLGLLQNGSIEFSPAINEHLSAIQQLGFGSVIKLLFMFSNNFWKSYADDIGFILSDQQIPTWWTQIPTESNLLTGWLGGPKAATMSTYSDNEILQAALESLANIFGKSVEELQDQLTHYKIICWQNNPYTKGGYSYMTLDSIAAKTKLSEPIADTIFFAGEAYYSGASQGTVEAALQSGMDAAQKLKKIR